MGRPLKFQSKEELEDKIEAYFTKCLSTFFIDSNGNQIHEPLTITGLALALDTTRQTLIEYEERDEYIDTIKRAKTIVENYAEKRLFGSSPTGAIFALKNYGWRDKIENELYGKDGKPIEQSITVKYVDSKDE